MSVEPLRGGCIGAAPLPSQVSMQGYERLVVNDWCSFALEKLIMNKIENSGQTKSSCLKLQRTQHHNLVLHKLLIFLPLNLRQTFVSFSGICPDGQQLEADKCTPCEAGHYKNIDTFWCVECEDGWTTPSTGSVSAADCSVGTCTCGGIQPRVRSPPLASYFRELLVLHQMFMSQ